jgi:CubicO group peptidase (beta-lactamase class C family)
MNNKITLINMVLIISTTLLMSTISLSQENKIKMFDEYLIKFLENKNAPSISAGILKNGEVIWLNAKGVSDLEDNDLATTSSLYRIASISKPITAVAIMQLWEKGLIELDKDVRFYLPDFPEKKWKFTVRQLMNHTAGIRGYKDGEFHNKKYYSSISEAVKVFAYDSLNYEPGTKYEYTSLDYSLLALIIEKVSDLTFEKYLIENIFSPAGMSKTKVDKQQEIIENRAKGYEKNYQRKIKNAQLADLSIKIAGGGLLSTAHDLLLFTRHLLEGKLIKNSTLELMFMRAKLKNGSFVDYGLGFALEYEGEKLKSISHTGGGTGFSTMLLIYPNLNLAAVHLINISDRNLGLPSEDLLNIELTDKFILPKKTLSDELMKTYLSLGIDSTIVKYNEVYKHETDFFNVNETEALAFARDLVGLNKPAAAIFYLRELLKLYPKSFSVLVSLAEAYYKDKNHGLALKYYRMASQINKHDTTVNNMILKLSK